jgi:hypothetical protein
MRALFGDAGAADAGDADDLDVDDLEVDDVDDDDLETDAGDDAIDAPEEPVANAGHSAGAIADGRNRGGAGTDDRREQRVAVSEARALLERSQRLLPRMTPADREETLVLQKQIEETLQRGDWARLSTLAAEIADLLFYVEER